MMKSRRKLLSIALTAMLAMGMLAFAPLTARADVSGAAGPVGLPGTIAIGAGPAASATPTIIGFGGHEWVVIGYDGTGVAPETGAMTLLLKNGDAGGGFGTTTYGTSSVYEGSTLQQKMVDIYNGAASPFSPAERNMIPAATLDGIMDASYNRSATLSGQYIWPLSTGEANTVHNSVRGFSARWWLRSPGVINYFAAYVDSGGDVVYNGNRVDNNYAVRPAFKLNLSSVLFTSEAALGGATPVSPPAAFTPPATALKFTTVDSAFSPGFGITETAVSGVPGGPVTLHYTGAAIGPSHFIRVKLINSAGQIAYVAVPVSNIMATGGSCNLALPAGMPLGTYTAYAWVEEGNGVNLTNRGSTPDTFTVTVNAPSSAKDITAFTIPNQVDNTVITDTSATAGSIALTMPHGTNVTSLAPGITVSPNATVSPASGVARDFTGPVTYIVTAQDGSTKTYTVTVTVQPPAPSATIGNVTISGTVGAALGGGQTATITLANDTVAAALVNADASGWFTGLPAGITVTANAPAGSSTITLTFGGTPAAASSQPFAVIIPGSVLTGGNAVAVAANPGANFHITAALSGDKAITAFSINGVPGVISGTSITVSLPYGTDVTNLAPQITHTGASISPASGAAQNFTRPVQYTVTAQDGTTQVYTVTVTVQPPPSDLPKTGDSFPLGGLLALMGALAVAMGWLGLRLRGGKAHG